MQGSNCPRTAIERKSLFGIRSTPVGIIHRKQSGLTGGIRGCFNCIQELHCLNIIEINLVL